MFKREETNNYQDKNVLRQNQYLEQQKLLGSIECTIITNKNKK